MVEGRRIAGVGNSRLSWIIPLRSLPVAAMALHKPRPSRRAVGLIETLVVVAILLIVVLLLLEVMRPVQPQVRMPDPPVSGGASQQPDQSLGQE